MSRGAYVVDTHALLWFVAGSSRLGLNAKAVLEDPESRLWLPATALAEACWIVEHSRVPLTLPALLAAIDADDRIAVCALTRQVIETSTGLTAVPEMHDRQIVATAIVLGAGADPVPVVTRDASMTASGLVPVVW